MNTLDHQALNDIANTVRGLSMDAIQAAGCGHPGLPLGCAEIGAYLFSNVLNFVPNHPQWMGRDRFVLSAGHGSMLLYSLLHLSGYGVTLDDIKNFRKYHSPTAGHPEYSELPGIETTTGPLGQGIATGIGMAMGNKMGTSRFKLDGLLEGKVYILAGDGCMMEGISSEASSLAGHLKLDNVVLIYDANEICLDGPISECLSEDVGARYRAYGWDVISVDGHDFDELHRAFTSVKTQTRPILIIAKTTIGKGSPTYQGTSDVHGKALGAEEVVRAKQALGIPVDPEFYVPQTVLNFFKTKHQDQQQMFSQWTTQFSAWKTSHPEEARLVAESQAKLLTPEFESELEAVAISSGVATRTASGAVLQFLHQALPYIVGGSADLSGSDNTMMKSGGIITCADFSGRNIKFGVREFAMAAMCSGLSLHGLFQPFCGTFLTFSDYMRNAIRLAALMKLPVVYQFTHDSVFLGEDGPTHQPVEHVASLRAMPGLTVIRPADATEVKGAWLAALKATGPTALILSRQNAPDLEATRVDGVLRGAYVVLRESRPQVDYCLIATGTEVKLALDVATALVAAGKSVRVVSMPSFELFDRQDLAYRQHVLGGEVARFVSIEALTSFGWHKYVGSSGVTISVDTFGLSAPAKDLAKHFGFTVEQILAKL